MPPPVKPRINTDDAVRRLRPWDEQVGLDASVTNVAKGKRSINRGLDKQASMIPLPVGAEAKFYSSGHDPASHLVVDNPKSRSFHATKETQQQQQLPPIDGGAGDRGVWLTYRQTIAGENLRASGPRVYYPRRDCHAVRDDLVGGFYRNLAREQVRAADLADELRVQRLEAADRQARHADAAFALLLAQTRTRGFDGTRRPPVRRAGADDKKAFAKSMEEPECLTSRRMERWAPHAKVIL